MPDWVDAGLPNMRSACRAKRASSSGAQARAARRTGEARARDGGGAHPGALPAGCVKVALDERGTLINTMELARRMARWREAGRDVAFIIGGADGLDEGVKRAADFVWSLSPLTLPHGLARVVLAEQLYRAVLDTAQSPLSSGVRVNE